MASVGWAGAGGKSSRALMLSATLPLCNTARFHVQVLTTLAHYHRGLQRRLRPDGEARCLCVLRRVGAVFCPGVRAPGLDPTLHACRPPAACQPCLLHRPACTRAASCDHDRRTLNRTCAGSQEYDELLEALQALLSLGPNAQVG